MPVTDKLTQFRRHRLVVRTSGFHPGNRGSIPRGATIKDIRFFSRRLTTREGGILATGVLSQRLTCLPPGR